MSTLIQKISKGQRKALTQSYEENKDKIFYIATNIDKAHASKATIWAFKNVWNDIISKSNIKEEDFSRLVVLKLAAYMQRNSSNAKKDTLSICENLSNSFSESSEALSIPTDVNNVLYDTINKIATPVEQHDKNTIKMFGIIGVIAVILTVVLVIFLSNPDDNNDNDSSFTNSESTGSTNNSNGSSADVQIAIPKIAADIDETLNYYADIIIEDYGTITVKLEPDYSPITVANFVGLAQSGFYDGLTFHRIMEGFMMQGGDPLGTGMGGSEEKIFGEFATNGFRNDLSHTRGAISMARGSYDANSASSQFFIVHEDCIQLDGNYAVFGYVTEGIEVVDAVCEAAEPTDNNGSILGDEQPVMKTITIRTEPKETVTE